ncbi:MAG: hypothetical protein M3R14_00015 [Acidobacteriota bacterium]|nr:hypothetical protein [Acidobacteriota bacterium]
MNNVPRQTLRLIINKYGQDLCGDRRRCEELLKDLCGEYRREINVLTSALEERVPLDLLAAATSMPHELLLTKLTKRLEDNLGLTGEASRWAVNSWALALEILTESEIQQKELKEKKRDNILTTSSPKTTEPYIEQDNKNVSRNNPPQFPQRTTQTQSRPPLPKIYPPIARTPANVPMPSPNSSPQKSGSNVNFPQNQAQPTNSQTTPAPKKRFRKFFGCLFVFFLIVVSALVLVFGVPYAINVMRETQQQSEPPRFPSQ